MLRRFAAEVHRITAEVGVIDRLGGQAEVDGARGSWQGMLSSLNHMAGCLTEQVRDVSNTLEAIPRRQHPPGVRRVLSGRVRTTEAARERTGQPVPCGWAQV